MRRLLKTTVEILDGAPAEYGRTGWRGQSVVELALVTPLLIFLLVGLVEVGWFANNYIVLLEASRVGARYGTQLTQDNAPFGWNNDLTAPSLNIATPQGRARDCSEVTRDSSTVQGFYNLVACRVQVAMQPLLIDNPNFNSSFNDIIVSAFSLKLVDPNNLPTLQTSGSAANLRPAPVGVPNNAPRIMVVGRYPTNANECGTLEPNDPFDYFMNQTRDFRLLVQPIVGNPPDLSEGNRSYVEVAYERSTTTWGFDTGTDTTGALGWSFRGRHIIAGTSCIGSEWTSAEIEQLVNLPTFSLSNNERRERLPDRTGMVIVEVFWQHSPLLRGFPLWAVFNDFLENPLYIWAAFPLPSVEPAIAFE